jgi:3alpha(or 20beta)-hydroxysteroid dehydrogenase
MRRLTGKVALVTGAASGQGAEEARLFIAEGANVVLTDLNEADGKALADQLGRSALFLPHDVSDEASWRGVVERACDAFGTIDILVNNAGIYRQQSLQNSTAALMDLHYRVNVLGTFLGMSAVHPVMQRAGGGSIINVGSVAGLRGLPGIFAYASSKWSVRGMTKCAAVDLAVDKIRVNSVLPGLIDTPMLAGNTPEYLDSVAQTIPLKRLGLPDDVARAVLYLASDDAIYVTGTEITVCGGVGV